MIFKTRRAKIITVILLALIILTVAFIWSNSLKDSEASNCDSNAVIAFFRPVMELLGVMTKKDQIYFIRKGAHLSEFFLLGSLFAALFSHIRKRWIGLAAFAGLSVAVLDEYIQAFSDRTSIVSDVLIDFSGYAAGFAAVTLIFLIVIKRRRKRLERGAEKAENILSDITARTADPGKR